MTFFVLFLSIAFLSQHHDLTSNPLTSLIWNSLINFSLKCRLFWLPLGPLIYFVGSIASTYLIAVGIPLALVLLLSFSIKQLIHSLLFNQHLCT